MNITVTQLHSDISKLCEDFSNLKVSFQFASTKEEGEREREQACPTLAIFLHLCPSLNSYSVSILLSPSLLFDEYFCHLETHTYTHGENGDEYSN